MRTTRTPPPASPGATTAAPVGAAATPASPVLCELLDEELAFSASYRRVYSNHLAMALVALEQLGAGPDVLRRTVERHRRGDPEWRDDTDELDRRRAEVARDGIAATVADRVPTLADGPGTALFHPVIRLAYALDVGHEGQVAAALLDWERRHDVAPVAPLHRGDRRLAEVGAALSAAADVTWRHTYDLDATARRPEVHAALDGLAVDEATLDDVSAFALAAHLAADDFLTLHLVTGARAVRAVAGWVDDATAVRLAGHAAIDVAVVHAAVGAPALPSPDDLERLRHQPVPPRSAIAERATVARDPHVIKLANVALVEEARTGDPLYRLVAARVVGLAA